MHYAAWLFFYRLAIMPTFSRVQFNCINMCSARITCESGDPRYLMALSYENCAILFHKIAWAFWYAVSSLYCLVEYILNSFNVRVWDMLRSIYRTQILYYIDDTYIINDHATSLKYKDSTISELSPDCTHPEFCNNRMLCEVFKMIHWS